MNEVNIAIPDWLPKIEALVVKFEGANAEEQRIVLDKIGNDYGAEAAQGQGNYLQRQSLHLRPQSLYGEC